MKLLGRIGAGLLLASVLLVSLMAGCGGSGATVTVTAGGGAGSTKTVTVTGGGTGGAMGDIVVYADMVSNVGCLATSVGHRGELLVFRARIVDPKTGKDMTDKEIQKDSVQAILPDGQKFNMTYGGHPGGGTPTDYFWAGIWEVPLNYPTGSLGYKIQAVASDGRTGTFQPFEVASSKLSIKEFDVNFVRPWTVNITATGFNVATLTITQGAKVTFSNKDTIPHKVVGDGWDSGDIAASKTYVRIFDKAGTFVVKDAANPAFTVTIVVNSPS